MLIQGSDGQASCGVQHNTTVTFFSLACPPLRRRPSCVQLPMPCEYMSCKDDGDGRSCCCRLLLRCRPWSHPPHGRGKSGLAWKQNRGRDWAECVLRREERLHNHLWVVQRARTLTIVFSSVRQVALFVALRLECIYCFCFAPREQQQNKHVRRLIPSSCCNVCTYVSLFSALFLVFFLFLVPPIILIGSSMSSR